MAGKAFEIGDLVRYNAVIPSYLPASKPGMGIVTQVGLFDVRIYSMTEKTDIVVRGTSCIVLSPAQSRGEG